MGRGAQKLSTSEGSLGTGGGNSRWASIGFARLLLPRGFLGLVTGDQVTGGPGRLRGHWAWQHCGHEGGNGFPQEGAPQPETWTALGRPEWRGWLPYGTPYLALLWELLLGVESRRLVGW